MANKTNPFQKMSEDRKSQQEQIVSNAKTTPKAEGQRGKGRPCIDESKGKKRDYCKTINIAVPMDKMELVNEYALQGRGVNLTEYINILIEKDLEKNLAKYKKEINRAVDFD